MKKQLTFVHGILILLTIITAFLSKFSLNKTVVIAIVLFSGIKFLLIAFHFMELTKANVLWKVSLSFFLVIQIGIVTLKI